MSKRDTMPGDPKQRDARHDARHDPWRAYISVAQIPDAGLHRDIEADEAARRAMADAAGLREIASARASFDLRHRRGGEVLVTGRVQARIGQSCVVTLDPIENEIDEAVDLIFAPQGTSSPQAALDENDGDDGNGAVDDAPEPIIDGVIDLGRLATDVLFLAIDPYPRKPGAVFEPLTAKTEPEDHPFAALGALRTDSDKGPPKKPKGG
jgi:uncharacterized metal-binding protein YceD (DUF177 family)